MDDNQKSCLAASPLCDILQGYYSFKYICDKKTLLLFYSVNLAEMTHWLITITIYMSV